MTDDKQDRRTLLEQAGLYEVLRTADVGAGPLQESRCSGRATAGAKG